MNKILFFVVTSVLVTLFGSTVSYANSGEKELAVGYEVITKGFDDELSTGLNFAIGYFVDDDTQIRLDIVHQIYEGTTWDASKDLWDQLGRSVSDSRSCQ